MREINEAYRLLRRKISELSFEESFKAAWVFSQYRQVRNFTLPNDVEIHASFLENPLGQPYPWQLETIIQEVILHAGEVSRRNRSLCKWETLADVVNSLRAVEEKLHERVAPDAITHELFRIGHQQFAWQRRSMKRFVGRNYQIYSHPKIDDICKELTGLAVAKIYIIGAVLWQLYVDNSFLRLPLTSSSEVVSQNELDTFLNLYSEEVYYSRQRIRSERPRIDETFTYDHRYIREIPLIRIRKAGVDFLACPLPTLLLWRFTSGLYYDLLDNPDFFNAFGCAFQEYIGRALARALEGTGISWLPEESYGTKKQPKNTVDWMLVDGDAAAFIECKAKRLTLKAKTTILSKEALSADIATLASYVVQVYKTFLHYKEGLYPSLPYNPERAVFPVIVTPEDWYPLGEAFWTMLNDEIRSQVAAEGLDGNIVDEFPITLASTEELEGAAQIIAAVGLRKFFSEYHSPKYAGWMLDRFMADAFSDQYKAVKDLFPETFDELIRMLDLKEEG